MVVDRELPIQPFGARRGTDEHEQPATRVIARPSRLNVPQDNTIEPLLSDQANDLGVLGNCDAGITRDLVDEVPRHGVGQVLPAYDQLHASAGPCKKQRGLPCRIPPANDHHGSSRAGLSLR